VEAVGADVLLPPSFGWPEMYLYVWASVGGWFISSATYYALFTLSYLAPMARSIESGRVKWYHVNSGLKFPGYLEFGPSPNRETKSTWTIIYSHYHLILHCTIHIYAVSPFYIVHTSSRHLLWKRYCHSTLPSLEDLSRNITADCQSTPSRLRLCTCCQLQDPISRIGKPWLTKAETCS
jgi:hypothetical protein